MPAGTALSVFPLAEKFGWSVEYVLWDLPLAVANQAITWVYFMNGCRLRPVRKTRIHKDDIARKIGISR